MLSLCLAFQVVVVTLDEFRSGLDLLIVLFAFLFRLHRLFRLLSLLFFKFLLHSLVPNHHVRNAEEETENPVVGHHNEVLATKHFSVMDQSDQERQVLDYERLHVRSGQFSRCGFTWFVRAAALCTRYSEQTHKPRTYYESICAIEH